MKLYTKSGDDGMTGLFGGQRVAKNDVRVTAYGEVDELNAAIGVVLSEHDDAELGEMLRRIQSDLFVIGALLATPDSKKAPSQFADESVEQLERWIDRACEAVPPLECFILPGGTPSAALLHLARTICRRAERAVVTLTQQQPIDPRIIVYLNRLSDLLFALARRGNHRAGVADIPWVAPRG
jgi:cob(I)alamin adenosyltransferase